MAGMAALGATRSATVRQGAVAKRYADVFLLIDELKSIGVGSPRAIADGRNEGSLRWHGGAGGLRLRSCAYGERSSLRPRHPRRNGDPFLGSPLLLAQSYLLRSC